MQDLNALYQVCVFRADKKNKMAAWPLIGWDIFDFFSGTAEWNSTKLDRNQDLNALYHVCVFWPIEKNKIAALVSWLAETFSTSPLKPLNRIQWNLLGSKISTPSTKFVFFWADRKNKMAALASDWLRHFRLLLWNCWTEFSETWQEASSQWPLPRLCFFQANREKTKWPPWPLIGWDIFDFPFETVKGIRRNLIGSKMVDRKNKMAALASDWLRHFQFFLWNRCPGADPGQGKNRSRGSSS